VNVGRVRKFPSRCATRLRHARAGPIDQAAGILSGSGPVALAKAGPLPGAPTGRISFSIRVRADGLDRMSRRTKMPGMWDEAHRKESYRLLIHDVSRLRRTAFDHLMKPLDITRSQWWVLNGLSIHGNQGITQSALAKLLDLGKVALGGIVERLEARGFVERRPDASDRRINRVFLTRKGNQILEQGWKIGLTLDSRVMRGISMARKICWPTSCRP